MLLHIIHSHFIPASLLILLPGIAFSSRSHPGYSLIHPLAVAEKDKREEEGTITRNTTVATLALTKHDGGNTSAEGAESLPRMG